MPTRIKAEKNGLPRGDFSLGKTLTAITIGMPLGNVLIVDYDQEFIKATKALLKSKGYRVITASNGKKALEKILSKVPQIVLLNLKIPDLSGRDLLTKIKKIDEQLAVIVTDHNGDLIPIDFMKLGVTESFSRPIKGHDLLKAMENAGRILGLKKEDESAQAPLLNTFFRFFAHEIRNPLQAIGGALTIIERRANANDPPVVQSISIIKEEVRHLTGFIQECLDFVRPPNKMHTGEIDLNETISHLLNLLTFMFKDLAKDITISSHFDPQLTKIVANFEEIKKVLLNILKNSFEAMVKRPGGILTVKTGRRSYNNKAGVEIIIQDTGSGIKKEDMNHIGTPFFTTKLKGTGLGLAICHRIIVERHKGKLRIESEEDKGTSVTITLPVSQEVALSEDNRP